MTHRSYIKFSLARIMFIVLVLLILSMNYQTFSQVPANNKTDYKAIFGKDYDFALSVIENEKWMTDSLEKDGLDPEFALAVIFPELIRYSSIIDYIQVKALEVLYVQNGRDYADFSIGLFQVKPSFAERIESDMIKYGLVDKFPSLSALQPDTSVTINSRKERILRIKNEYYQLLYLEAFLRIMDILYPGLTNGESNDKLIFYASAYNTGYFKGEAIIREEMSKNRFHRGMVEPAIKYSYADISLNYFLSQKAR